RVAFSPDGTTILTVDANRIVRLWDARGTRDSGSSGPLGLPQSHNGSFAAVTFSPDGQRFLTRGSHDAIRLSELPSRPGLAPALGQEKGVMAAGFSVDGPLAVNGGLDSTARVWDVGSGRPVGTPLRNERAPVLAVAFGPDRKTILATDRAQNI